MAGKRITRRLCPREEREASSRQIDLFTFRTPYETLIMEGCETFLSLPRAPLFWPDKKSYNEKGI